MVSAFGVSLPKELGVYVAEGLTPLGALRSATLNTTAIRAVVANGHYYGRATLDRLLTEAGQGWAQLYALRRRYAAEQERRAAAKAP